MLKVMLSKGRDVTRGLQLNSKGYIRIFVADGVHVNLRTGEHTDIVEMAKGLHFGTAKVPPRPFLDDAIRENWEEVSKLIIGSMVWRFRGLKADVQFAFAANDVAHVVRQFITDGSYYKGVAPNAPSTIENKGSDTPLLDSGQLVDHIQGEYVELR